MDSEIDNQVRKLHTLDATSTRTQNEGLRVSAVTWSSAGKVEIHILKTFKFNNLEQFFRHISFENDSFKFT